MTLNLVNIRKYIVINYFVFRDFQISYKLLKLFCMLKNLFLTTLQALFKFVVGPLLLVVFHVLIGAISGWFIGLFTGDSFLEILSKIGITNCTMWEFGVFMGFLSSFFRNFLTLNNFPIKTKAFLALSPLPIIISTLIGAISGWTIDLIFASSITKILSQIGITGYSIWTIGAFIGFVSSFFRSSIKFKNSKHS